MNNKPKPVENKEILVATPPKLLVPQHIAAAEAKKRRVKRKTFVPTAEDVEKAIKFNPMDPANFFLAKWQEAVAQGRVDGEKCVRCPVGEEQVQQYKMMGYEILYDENGGYIKRGDTVLMYTSRENALRWKRMPAILDASRRRDYAAQAKEDMHRREKVKEDFDYSAEAVQDSINQMVEEFDKTYAPKPPT